MKCQLEHHSQKHWIGKNRKEEARTPRTLELDTPMMSLAPLSGFSASLFSDLREASPICLDIHFLY